MTLAYREHPEAAEELLDTIRHYHAERPGLGADFATSARLAIEDIIESPDMWPRLPDWNGTPVLRSRRIGAFSYRVVYYVRGAEVVVIAYAHEKRRPGYWQLRMTLRMTH